MSPDIFTAFLARCVSDSVNANHKPHTCQEPIAEAALCSLATVPGSDRCSLHACEDCAGTGRVAVHVCATDEECRRKCLRVETCMGCLGTGGRSR